MPFGRGKSQGNRSQLALVDPGLAGGAAAAGPQAANGDQQQQQGLSSASAVPSTAFSSNDPTLPPHNATLQSGFVDSRGHPKGAQDIDQVGRSQSQRFQPVSPQPPAYGIASSSFEDIPTNTLLITSPLLAQGAHHPPTVATGIPASAQQPQQLQQQQQQQQSHPPEARRSTRKLIKNILAGSRAAEAQQQQQQQQQHQHQQQLQQHQQQLAAHQQQASIDASSLLPRRTSHRVSHTPSIRTGPSQVSLDQPTADWQSQGPLTQPSPLQGVGEFRDVRLPSLDRSAHDLLAQDHQHNTVNSINTIRHVQTDVENSPFAPEDVGIAYHHTLGQVVVQPAQQPSPENPYHPVQFDPIALQQQQQQQYQFQNPQQQGPYSGIHPVFTGGHLGANPQLRNPETVSQLSHESPTEADQLAGISLQTSTAVNFSPQPQSQDVPPSLGSQTPVQVPAQGQVEVQKQLQPSPSPQSTPLQIAQISQQQSPQAQQPQPQGNNNMAPAQGSQAPGRRSQEDKNNHLRGQMDPPPGPPPGYRHSQAAPGNPMPPSNPGGLNQNYRTSTIQDQHHDGAVEGRNSPQPPAAGEAADPERQFRELLTKYKNVKRLYFDGKNQIETLNGQVEQLQNAVANQRMSQSRTSLDDNDYTTRFKRLNGAIMDLAFNVRKDWVTLPSWLERYVSPGALKTGKQEMTAVGRAAITRWVVEIVFNRCFHPGLDPDLSRQLKEIEQNIRRFSYTMNSQEEFEALTSKVVSWRMATLEGLQRVLSGPENGSHRVDFTRQATETLTSSLFQHLANPPPAGVDGSASMIVELAVGIASNLPLESRDVAIMYPLPETTIQPNLMEVVEPGLPPLETRPSDGSDDRDDSDDEDRGGGGGGGGGGAQGGGKESGLSREPTKGGGGSRNNSRAERASRPGPAAATAAAEASAAQQSAPPTVTPNESAKVRFAGFVTVEVRGRQVLAKAPVWTLG